MSFNERFYDELFKGVGGGDRRQPFVLPTVDGDGWSMLPPRWGEDDQGGGEAM